MVDGGYAYGYLFISQNRDAERVFKELLDDIRPKRILEIGTFHGGLTLLLRDIMDNLNLHNNPIYTYDINEQNFLKPLVNNRNIKVYTTNLFNSEYTDFNSIDIKNKLTDLIQDFGRTLVLCDGGCKKCEFKLLSGLLKINDIIMAHDYAPNQDYFEQYIKNKIWDWMEIQDSDIQDSIDKYNLKDFRQNMTQQAAWCCKIKV